MFARALLSKHLKKQEAKLMACEAQRAGGQGDKRQSNIEGGVTGVSNVRAAEFSDAIESEVAHVPLTALQAKALRISFSQDGSTILPWQIIAWQFVVGILMSLLVGLVSGKVNIFLSVAYGAIAVVLPAALFARGLMSQFSSLNAMTAGFGFFVWEALKIAVTIALIAMAPSLVVDLDWLAMLAGLIVTMKVVWVILWLTRRIKNSRQPAGLK